MMHNYVLKNPFWE